ncbi:MAG TPA: FMN-binding glutamate synthase family protein [Candidatus Deferrimicrobium sp.]|nr:FMN-binding glutamate synthase family protein [Candidatus Deferrimicrobium sp.]
MADFSFWFWFLLLSSLAIILLLNFSKLTKLIIKQVFGHIIRTIMTDPYEENILELYSAGKRMGLQKIMEANLRSEFGKAPLRPFGSPLKFPGFDDLLFDVAQLHILPIEESTSVDMKVVIGPRAKKPLILDMPIMIGGMAYGFALSAKAKIALARGASLAGTATNSGGGAFLQAERDNAKHFILQYNRAFWNKDAETLRKADAIEIQLGQGSMAGLSHSMPAKDIDQELQTAFPIPPGCDAVVQARFPDVQEPSDFSSLVQKIRQQVDGVPVGVKLAGGKNLELDLKILLDAGVDFIVLGGAQAGTHGSPPSISDSYGLPTLFNLVRARKFLELHNAVGKVSLIVSGGISDPGEMLKALALGADALYIGTAAIFAISHTQVLKALPWEPPTQIVWYNAKYSSRFDENKGAQNLANYLKACAQEMADGLRVMGKTSLKELSKKDLFGLSKSIAEITGVTLAYQPYKIRVQGFAKYSLVQKRCVSSLKPSSAPIHQSPLQGSHSAPDKSSNNEPTPRRYKYQSRKR